MPGTLRMLGTLGPEPKTLLCVLMLAHEGTTGHEHSQESSHPPSQAGLRLLAAADSQGVSGGAGMLLHQLVTS